MPKFGLSSSKGDAKEAFAADLARRLLLLSDAIIARSKLPIRTLISFCWLLTVGGGFIVLLNYQESAGGTGFTPMTWPSASALRLARGQDTLIMFAHPKCPCSQASLEELNRALAKTAGKVSVRVLFFKPAQGSNDWTNTTLYRTAASISGVTALEDIDGQEAGRFGANTSGYVVLYKPSGDLLFKGGITAGRGHAGDNAGESALVALILGQDSAIRQTAVYGCSLFNKRCTTDTTTPP